MAASKRALSMLDMDPVIVYADFLLERDADMSKVVSIRSDELDTRTVAEDLPHQTAVELADTLNVGMNMIQSLGEDLPPQPTYHPVADDVDNKDVFG